MQGGTTEFDAFADLGRARFHRLELSPELALAIILSGDRLPIALVLRALSRLLTCLDVWAAGERNEPAPSGFHWEAKDKPRPVRAPVPRPHGAKLMDDTLLSVVRVRRSDTGRARRSSRRVVRSASASRDGPLSGDDDPPKPPLDLLDALALSLGWERGA